MAEPLSDEELIAIESAADCEAITASRFKVVELVAEVRRLREGDDEVCETCVNWTRDESRGPSNYGNCAEFACDGRTCLMFESEFCSRWKART